MILCIGTTPAAQRVMVFSKLSLDAVNRATTTVDGWAGKSVNAAKVLRELGESVVAVGVAGGHRGIELVRDLKRRGIETEFEVVGEPTRQCITVIDEGHGTTTELVEESRAVAPEVYERLVEAVARRVKGCRAMVLSGTLTPRAPEDFYRRCAYLAQTEGVLSVVDAKGPPLLMALRAGVGLIKPNRGELALTVGHELRDEASVIQAMRDLHAVGAARVVVSAGKEPALASDGERTWRIHPPSITALNAIGSGDSFTAALTCRLVQGDNLGEACRWGVAAGAANALSLMPGELQRSEVERLCRQAVVEVVR